MDYKHKYLKYKHKYLEYNKTHQSGGGAINMPTLYLFKADWCGHCKAFAPDWKKLEIEFKNKINFIKYDSEKHAEEITEWKVTGYPTIYFKVDNKTDHIEYDGSRKLEDIILFLNQILS